MSGPRLCHGVYDLILVFLGCEPVVACCVYSLCVLLLLLLNLRSGAQRQRMFLLPPLSPSFEGREQSPSSSSLLD